MVMMINLFIKFLIYLNASIVAATTMLLPESELAATSMLLPQIELTGNCYDSPDKAFSRINCIKAACGQSPQVILDQGDQAIDFTVHTIHGENVQLKQLLKTLPVVMIWGMYTCPAFQGLSGGDNAKFKHTSRMEEWTLVEKYHHRGDEGAGFHFLHIYGPEPHPNLPDLNYDSGAIKLNYWSTINQAYTYQDRAAAAKKILPLLHPNATLVIDPLQDGNPYAEEQAYGNNPLWCSYLHGARGVVVINQNGIIEKASDWFHADEIEAVLQAMML